MTRKTLYGTLTHDEVMNENEKAMLYIKECAELVGLEVIDGKTAFSITFMAEVMKRLREKHEPILDKIREQIKSNIRGVEITLEVLAENDPLIPKMEGAKDTLENCLEIIDKAESEGEE